MRERPFRLPNPDRPSKRSGPDHINIAAKGAVVNSVNSEVSGLNATNIVGLHNVEKFILLNILKSELRYCNSFPNGSETK